MSIDAAEDLKLNKDATEQPVPVSLAELEKNPRVKNPHITIGPHVRLYNAAVFSYTKSKYDEGPPKPDARVSDLYYPIVSSGHPLVKLLAARSAEDPDHPTDDSSKTPIGGFAVLVKTGSFSTVGSIPAHSEESAAVTGLVINRIHPVGYKQAALLRDNFPSLDLDKVLIVEEGRNPVPPAESQWLMLWGALIALAALYWAFAGTLRPTNCSFCEGCGVEAPTRRVSLFENVGLLIQHRVRFISGCLCKRCVHRNFWTFTAKTLFLGWWGMISMLVTPFNLLNNLIAYMLCVFMPAVPEGEIPPTVDGATAQRIKQVEQEAFQRLRAGEALDQVVRDVAPRTDATRAQVALWLRHRQAEMAQSAKP